ncbi:MAG TPA: FAD-binding protein [Euzebyales bacterium]
MTAPAVVVSDVEATDVVVVGSGAAGMAAALSATDARVTLLTADRVASDSASAHASGGLAAAVAATDSPAAHAADTLAVGAHANDRAVVDLLTSAAPGTVDWLDGIGTRFARDATGWVLGREAGHRHDRILHAGGDATGREITRAMAAAVSSAPHVTVRDRTSVVALLVDGGHVVGVLARRRSTEVSAPPQHHTGAGMHDELVAIGAGAVVLATGGSAGAWRDTTNPPGSRGSGLVLAADAGAELTDLQYVQFHPTALDCGTDPLPLLTEALRGAGGAVVDARGRRFLDAVHPDAELAPRDVVARAVWQRRSAGDRVLLDLRRIDGLVERFPTAVAACHAHGFDPLLAPVPITPAAHYHMGGIVVDRHGRTGLEGLFACGEVACTGAHGANRLASNSLLEALVFGRRVGTQVRHAMAPPAAVVTRAVDVRAARLLPTTDPTAIARVRELLTTHVGVLRSGPGLREALHELTSLAAPAAGGTLAALARMVAAAALAHTERRGAHWRTDGTDALPDAPRIVVRAPGRRDPHVEHRAVTTDAGRRDDVLAGTS